MQVGDIQRALVQAGFNPGPVDGLGGPKTSAALSAFQKAHGLSPSGSLDSKTQAALFGGVTQSDSFQAPKGQTFKARGTGYYPDKSALEGGFTDRVGKPLNTLQDYLSGKAPYVSVAMDSEGVSVRNEAAHPRARGEVRAADRFSRGRYRQRVHRKRHRPHRHLYGKSEGVVGPDHQRAADARCAVRLQRNADP